MANTTRPSVPPSHSSGVEHRRQLANVLNLLNQTTPDYSETTDERDAGVSIIAKSYSPGDPRRIKEVESGLVVINIPSDVETMQDAIDLFPLRVPGVTTVLNIESGHALTAGITVTNGDYGHIVIRSEDAEVAVANGFIGHLLFGSYARMPVLDTVIDMNGRGGDGYAATEGSIGLILPNAGIKNASGRAAYANGSRLVCSGATLTGSGTADLYVALGGKIVASDTTTTNGIGSPAVGDTNVAAFNAIDGNNGVIWA